MLCKALFLDSKIYQLNLFSDNYSFTQDFLGTRHHGCLIFHNAKPKLDVPFRQTRHKWQILLAFSEC